MYCIPDLRGSPLGVTKHESVYYTRKSMFPNQRERSEKVPFEIECVLRWLIDLCVSILLHCGPVAHFPCLLSFVIVVSGSVARSLLVCAQLSVRSPCCGPAVIRTDNIV